MKAENYTLKSYGEGSLILNELEPLNYEYRFLGCDYPIQGDNEWRFWIEYGCKNGEAITETVNLKDEEKETIKKLVMEFITTV